MGQRVNGGEIWSPWCKVENVYLAPKRGAICALQTILKPVLGREIRIYPFALFSGFCGPLQTLFTQRVIFLEDAWDTLTNESQRQSAL